MSNYRSWKKEICPTHCHGQKKPQSWRTRPLQLEVSHKTVLRYTYITILSFMRLSFKHDSRWFKSCISSLGPISRDHLAMPFSPYWPSHSIFFSLLLLIDSFFLRILFGFDFQIIFEATACVQLRSMTLIWTSYHQGVLMTWPTLFYWSKCDWWALIQRWRTLLSLSKFFFNLSYRVLRNSKLCSVTVKLISWDSCAPGNPDGFVLAAM